MSRGWAHSKRQKPKADEAREVLSNLVFSHVPVIAFNFQQKVRVRLRRGQVALSFSHPQQSNRWQSVAGDLHGAGGAEDAERHAGPCLH